MATVPTMDEGSAVERPLPTTPQALPSPGAFGGQVGQAVEGVGEEVSRIAQDEMQKAAGDRALQAETAYQELVSKKVYDVNEGFASLTGEKALAASAGVKQSISQDRERIAASLGSRYAARLFMNNSQRILRFAQDHVDAYAGQQRRVMQAQTYTRFVTSAAQTAATMAAAKDGYNQDEADALLENVQKKAYERAAQLGLSEEDAHDLAAKSLSVPVDALLGTLAKTGNPKAREEYDRWGAFLSPTKTASVESALAAKEGNQLASSIVFQAPRVDMTRKGTPDADGRVDWSWVTARVQKVPADQRSAVEAATKKMRAELEDQFQEGIKLRKDQIIADGSDENGHFQAIDPVKSSDELAWLRRNYPPGVAELERSVAGTSEKADRYQHYLAGRRSDETLTKWYTFMSSLSDDEIMEMKRSTALDYMTKYYPELNDKPSNFKAALNLLPKLQKLVPKVPIAKINSYVNGAINNAFPKDANARRQWKYPLQRQVMQALIEDSIEKTDASIQTFIKERLRSKRIDWHSTSSTLEQEEKEWQDEELGDE